MTSQSSSDLRPLLNLTNDMISEKDLWEWKAKHFKIYKIFLNSSALAHNDFLNNLLDPPNAKNCKNEMVELNDALLDLCRIMKLDHEPDMKEVFKTWSAQNFVWGIRYLFEALHRVMLSKRGDIKKTTPTQKTDVKDYLTHLYYVQLWAVLSSRKEEYDKVCR